MPRHPRKTLNPVGSELCERKDAGLWMPPCGNLAILPAPVPVSPRGCGQQIAVQAAGKYFGMRLGAAELTEAQICPEKPLWREEDSPVCGVLAVGVTCAVTTAVAKGDRRIMSPVSHQMLVRGKVISCWARECLPWLVLHPPVTGGAARKAAALKGMERDVASPGQDLGV